jgi:hypothetical protein
MKILHPVVILPVMSLQFAHSYITTIPFFRLFAMRFNSFQFNLRELAGSMSDFGRLFPIAIGYIVINGLNPASFQ